MSISFVIMILSMIIVSYAEVEHKAPIKDLIDPVEFEPVPKDPPTAVDLDDNYLHSVKKKFEKLFERVVRDSEKKNKILHSYQNCLSSLQEEKETQDHQLFRCFMEAITFFSKPKENDDRFLEEVCWRMKQFTVDVDTDDGNDKDFNKSYEGCMSSPQEKENMTHQLFRCIGKAIDTYFTNLDISYSDDGIMGVDLRSPLDSNDMFLYFAKLKFGKLLHTLDERFQKKNKVYASYQKCLSSLQKEKETQDHQLFRCFMEAITFFSKPKKFGDTFLNEVNWKVTQFIFEVDVDYNSDTNFRESYKNCIDSPREKKEIVISSSQEEKEKEDISSVQKEKESGLSSIQEEKSGISSPQEEKESEAPIVSHVIVIESEAHQLFRCIATTFNAFLNLDGE